MNTFAFYRSFMLLTVAITLGGCSSFESDWQAALKRNMSAAPTPAPAPTPIPVGDAMVSPTWIGTWHSVPSGHEGPLRCIATRMPEKEESSGSTQHYAFHFHALWGLNFPAEYTIEMTVKKEGDRIVFEGEQDLGPLAGGVYRCKGDIQGDQFKATYESKHDHGTFEMKRITKEE